MGRRRNAGLFETLTLLPWPVGIGFGIAGFALIHWGVRWLAGSLGGTLGQSLGTVMEAGTLDPVAWALLALGMLAAAISAFRSGDRKRLLDEQRNLESLRALSWSRFEQLVGEAFRRHGYSVEETGQGGADGGVDLLLRKDGAVTLVQCKHWRSRQVGVAVVREMYGLMHHHRAAAVKIVCTGVFSSDCYRFAVGKPLELIDGEALNELIGKLKSVPSLEPVASSAPSADPAAALVPPSCPQCAAIMVERKNRASGQAFWGCSTYPRCRGTVAIG
jgi:restriction system protein